MIIKKHHQRKILGGVRVFSAKNAEPRSCFFIYALSTVYVVVGRKKVHSLEELVSVNKRTDTEEE